MKLTIDQIVEALVAADENDMHQVFEELCQKHPQRAYLVGKVIMDQDPVYSETQSYIKYDVCITGYADRVKAMFALKTLCGYTTPKHPLKEIVDKGVGLTVLTTDCEKEAQDLVDKLAGFGVKAAMHQLPQSRVLRCALSRNFIPFA